MGFAPPLGRLAKIGTICAGNAGVGSEGVPSTALFYGRQRQEEKRVSGLLFFQRSKKWGNLEPLE